MKRYIVTGGSGFIGYHLADYLSNQENIEVTVMDNHARGEADDMFNELIAKENVKFIKADMTNKDFYDKLEGFYDGIYHLAAINGTKNFYERPYEVLRANILTLMNMLEWCDDKNCGAFLYSSSSEAYAGTLNKFLPEHPEFIPTKEDIPLTIDDSLNPRWSYGGSKLLGEILTANYCRTHNMSFRIIRYHNIYGKRMGFLHVLPEFFKRIHERLNPFPIYGGEETRAFCHISDAVVATEKVLLEEKCNGEIIHIGNSEEEIKIKDLLNLALKTANFNPKVDVNPAPAGSVKRRLPNTDKLYELTGFKAKVTLKEGLKDMYEWYEKKYSEIDKKI